MTYSTLYKMRDIPSAYSVLIARIARIDFSGDQFVLSAHYCDIESCWAATGVFKAMRLGQLYFA